MEMSVTICKIFMDEYSKPCKMESQNEAETQHKKSIRSVQGNFKQILNLQHELCQLANEINWSRFEVVFEGCYSSQMGAPAKAVRLMVGLHYLKYMFNESDESVVERWTENPYWQYFCGFDFMQHECPIHPTTLVKWRQRVGARRLEQMLKETVELAVLSRHVTRHQLKKVTVDTTVQEKAVAYPTDARLYQKARCRLVKLAKKREIPLRQSYSRVGKHCLIKQSRYANARQFKRARSCTRKLRTYLGRVIRDIERKSKYFDGELSTMLKRAKRIHQQRRTDKHKLYSLDAPEVSCIAKGKAHKRFEFGSKISITTSNRGNWILGVHRVNGNRHDSKTLAACIKQTERITGVRCVDIFADKGYRGSNYKGNAAVYIAGTSNKDLPRSLRLRKKRRSAVEPKIGHLKSDNRLGRNYLRHKTGDIINAILAASGANLRKLLRRFYYELLECWLNLRIQIKTSAEVAI